MRRLRYYTYMSEVLVPGLQSRSIRDEVSVFSGVIANAIEQADLLDDGYQVPIADSRHGHCRYIELSHGSLAPPGESAIYAPAIVRVGELVMRVHIAEPRCQARSSELLYMRLVTRSFTGSVLDAAGHNEECSARTFMISDGPYGSFQTAYLKTQTLSHMRQSSTEIDSVVTPIAEHRRHHNAPSITTVRRTMEMSFNDIFNRYVTMRHDYGVYGMPVLLPDTDKTEVE